MPTYIVLLGPPGSGKGTQAQAISKELGLPHISSGDIFRENIKENTDLGKLAKSFMDRGELVPDDITIAMIRERLARPDCQPGALLDGFPRTIAQADSLNEMLQTFGGCVNAVPYINVPPNVLIERLGGRWTCREQGHVFHEKYSPSNRPGICDYDGSELYQREDDQPATVSNRINVYFAQTLPLIEYYKKASLLVEIDGTQTIEKVTADLLSALSLKIK